MASIDREWGDDLPKAMAAPPPDEAMRDELAKRREQASEARDSARQRAASLQDEAKRWDRIASACSAALAQLDSPKVDAAQVGSISVP